MFLGGRKQAKKTYELKTLNLNKKKKTKKKITKLVPLSTLGCAHISRDNVVAIRRHKVYVLTFICTYLLLGISLSMKFVPFNLHAWLEVIYARKEKLNQSGMWL